MKAIQKFFAWIRGPKSDFFLFAIVLILLNLVGSNAFLRLDLTSQHSYSLSKVSRETIRSLEEPLSVKVFFSSNLPSPYNGAERYLKDLLVEYSGTGSKRFSYEFFDMTKTDNQNLARSYGINEVQIQEVKDTEVGLKNAFMGLAIVYSDRIEVLDNLTTSDGLEYKLTTTISKMVSTTNALSGLSGKVQMTLYASSDLGQFNIQGFKDLSKNVQAVYEKVNKKNMDRIEFATVDPASSDVASLASHYGLQSINWKAQGGSTSGGSGTLGIVLEYKDTFRLIPMEIQQGVFGGYGLAGLDTLEASLSDNLQSLMSKSLSVGYVTGHGELALNDEKAGAARFSSLISDIYEFKEIPTATADIPQNINSLVINGPKQQFTEAELYKIDQFLMRGGNLFLLVDPFNVIQPKGDMAYYGGQPVYEPISTGLEKLLTKYGVTLGKNYVLDKTCYVAQQQGVGDMPIYYVPLLGKESLNKKESVSRNLAYVLFLQSGSIDINAPISSAHRIVPLATSSSEAWLMSDNISLTPYSMQVPGKDAMAKRNLAVLLEGKFDSAFDKAPDVTTPAAGATPAGTTAAGTAFSDEKHLSKSLQNGKIIVMATSAITTPSVMDANGQQPVAILVRNSIDYLNGNGDLIDMRTKGLGFNTLNKTTPAVRTAARVLNLYVIPALIVLAGLMAWRSRVWRRRRIEARYARKDRKGMEA